jgi:putative hydrolase of the HAD superfamily
MRRVLPSFLEEWGWEGTLDDFVNTWLEVENAVDQRVVETVLSLRQNGYTCCLATSQERYRAEHMTNVMGFSMIFDRLFFSCHLGCAKPDHAYYRRIEEELGIEGEQVLFWDDTVMNVESARACGWNAEVYVSFEDFKQRLAEYLA